MSKKFLVTKYEVTLYLNAFREAYQRIDAEYTTAKTSSEQLDIIDLLEHIEKNIRKLEKHLKSLEK